MPERLFEDFQYFDYKFPEPQYLGAKYVVLEWIRRFIPQDVKSAFDAFGGSQSVSFLFKQLGFQTGTNDFLNFNYQIGTALIENSLEKLTDGDLEILFQESPNKNDFTLIEELFTDVFFEREEAFFLDNFRANIPLMENVYKQALAFTVMCRSMTRKITMGHFAHTQALSYANNPERVRRNRSLTRPVKDIFCELLPLYNNIVFDNSQQNISYHKNVLELLPEIQHVDLIYFDPPYCNSHADYQSFYHLLETYTEYWKNKNFINKIKRYEPQRYSGFDKKSVVIESFEKLFALADVIQKVKIVSGNEVASLDTTGTLTQKYQARIVGEHQKYELISCKDTDNLLPYVANGLVLPDSTGPNTMPTSGLILPIQTVYEKLKQIVGKTISNQGATQDRKRGDGLHRLVCQSLGYKIYEDDGQFPDVRHQLLEVKMQTATTIDLGKILPTDDTRLPFFSDALPIRYCDVRYAVFYGEIRDNNVSITNFYLVCGVDFFDRFSQFQGNVKNSKLQIPLPANFFD